MNITLYVINGPSGAGKSHLLQYVESHFERARAIPKLTTRPRHPGEIGETWSDLIHVSEARFTELNPEFQYAWNGYRYGVSRAELIERLRSARIGLVVVRDTRTIRELAGSLPGIDIVPIFVTAKASTRERRLVAAGLDDSEVARRLDQDEASARHYQSCVDLYRSCIENETSPEEFQRRISALIAHHQAD
jgi:guanylate kinase